jgi:DNA processing protein
VSGGATEEPIACDPCLRRLHLLGVLAPFIEKVATGRPGERSPQLLALGDSQLARAVGGRKAEKLLVEATEADPEVLRDRIREADCWALCTHDPRYPPQLRDLGDAPPALIGRGELSVLSRLRADAAVTVVGARRATSYGREIARNLAAELAGAGFAVVSGLAWGVDGAAHEGALEGGHTVAVLGCGADVAYPRHHQRLYERIRERGVILSELPPGTTAWRWAFPARNRIMAALGAMTVVVEAAGHSGSLITAELASDLGRDVGAVPGPVGARMSAGTNQLLADGARLVRDAQDVLDALIGPGAARPVVSGPELDGHLGAVLDRIEGGDGDSDSIAVALSCGGGEATAALARLERLGYVQRSFAGTYSRTALRRPQPEASGEEADHLA